VTHALCLYLINTTEHNRFWWANISLVSLESPCSLCNTRRLIRIHICRHLYRRLSKDCGSKFLKTCVFCTTHAGIHHHHHHKHQGLDPLIHSVSKVTNAFSKVSSVFQLFSFLVVCSSMISKGFGFVAWNYWDLWQATPFMTTRQTATYAANYRL